MNKTAMMQLRDRLQARCESDSCSEYEEIILDGVINCIDTELLEIEKLDHENTFNESRLTHPMVGFKHDTFEEYYLKTFNPK
jgi:hypothetical protein